MPLSFLSHMADVSLFGLDPTGPHLVNVALHAANVFLLLCPRLGWRRVAVTDRRTKADFARQMKAVVDEHFPAAAVVRVVLDNLNTHTKGALSEAFGPAEARRIADRLEFVDTPTRASWLNMAALEWSVLKRQCLDRRIGTADDLAREVGACVRDRNAAGARIDWTFRVPDARIKLAHLYPATSL